MINYRLCSKLKTLFIPLRVVIIFIIIGIGGGTKIGAGSSAQSLHADVKSNVPAVVTVFFVFTSK
jgi:hypothetical protein